MGAAAWMLSGAAIGHSALERAVAQRLEGDRSGACVAVAHVQKGGVSRVLRCARPHRAGRPEPTLSSAFEIGSVSKTMTAALIALAEDQGRLTLDDPLSRWLPADSKVPNFEGQPIRLRHLLTHSAALPALPTRMHGPGLNPANPYAALDRTGLLDSLATQTLAHAPGERFLYSNFGGMLASLIAADAAGQDFETAVREQLFQPLGMTGAHLRQRPEGVRPVQGHLGTGQPVPAWHFQEPLGGVGGVRATLPDMERYVQAHLGLIDTPLTTALQRTQQPLATGFAVPAIGMFWLRAPLAGRSIMIHEGATGGSYALVALDPAQRQGVVILADAALAGMGGLSSLGLHLLDASVPPGQARRELPAPAERIDALLGHYQMRGGPALELRRGGGGLEVQAEGQPAFAMGHDSAGDFFVRDFDAVLQAQPGADGRLHLLWVQGGAARPLRRLAR